MRAKAAFLNKIKQIGVCTLTNVTYQEVKNAEVFLLKYVQRESFPAVAGNNNKDIRNGMKAKANAAEMSIARQDLMFTENGLVEFHKIKLLKKL